MKILTTPPWAVPTGRVLTPSLLNAQFAYAKQAIDDVAARRWLIGTFPLSFAESAATPYTDATSQEGRSWRFTPLHSLIVDRAFLHANLTSSAEVTVNITTAAGATPAGATVPWLTTGGAVASAAADVTDIATERFTLQAGTTYVVTVASAGTFSLARCDVILHVRTDRWNQSGTPVATAVAGPAFTDATARDATAVNALQGAYASVVTSIGANTNQGMALPQLYTVPRLSSSTPLDARTFTLLRSGGGDGICQLRRVELFVVPSVATTTTYTVEVLNNSGAVVDSTSVVSSSTTLKTALLSPTINLGGSSAGVLASVTPAQDYALRFTSTGPACFKAYAVASFARS